LDTLGHMQSSHHAFAAKRKQVAPRKRSIIWLIAISVFIGFIVLWMLAIRSVATAGLRPTSVPMVNVVQRYVPSGGLTLYSEDYCTGDVVNYIEYSADEPNEVSICGIKYKSYQVTGNIEVDWFSGCKVSDPTYSASTVASEGCLSFHSYPQAQSLRLLPKSQNRQISDEDLNKQFAMQDHHPVKLPGVPAKSRIIFSCESAEYFGYQVWANLYGYLTTNQKSSTWTRLMTAERRDDLSDVVPGLLTFQAKRTRFARRYSPINKPDIIAKFLESPDSPVEDVLVVIDPDNWLLKDVSKYVDMVSEGNAVGEPAYYHGSRTAQVLWREVCEKNCDVDADLVGVPYFVHREDMKKIAPLWRYYTILLKEKMDKDTKFHEKFNGKMDLAWAAEMYGYNFASAHVGVKHNVVHKIQVRDVAGEHRISKLQDVAMIHVGRAWFPTTYKPAQQWAHTEGKSFKHFGQQVWCKCNYTASTIMPWPLPPNFDDFQSLHTLRILHESNERFGPVPINHQFRRGATHHDYGTSMN